MGLPNRTASINLARDLCLKLIERRALSPAQLPVVIQPMVVSIDTLFQELDDGNGLWLVRLARDITLKMIERNQVASLEAALSTLKESVQMLDRLTRDLDPELAVAALNLARDLSLKFLEAGRLSRASFPDFFAQTARAVAAGPE